MGYTNKHLRAFFCSSFVLLVLALWATLAIARPLDDHNALTMKERHQHWMDRHGRVYKDEEEMEMRFNIFKKNVERIENFNRNASSHKSFKLRVNAFADLATEEFAATHTGYKQLPVQHEIRSGYSLPDVNDIPLSMDWRERGAVTPVKYQAQCGCCWAFSAVAAVEGIHQIQTGQLVSLSEQELLDCAPNHGCTDGGFMTSAFSFIINNQGISTEDQYPYQGYQGQCRGGSSGVTITGYYSLPQGDETAIMQAVSQQPVSVALDASGFDFLYHGEGFFNGECSTEQNHAVALVGYGTATDGTDYWLLKNSWGESWGEGGYMKIVRGQNKCGVALNAVYPTIQ